MLVTRTKPGPRAAAAPVHQLYLTHCLFDEGVYRQAGFSVRASSTQDPLVLRFALEYPSYEVPTGLPEPRPQAASMPRRLALVRVPGGRSVLMHSAYLPEEERGRPNSFFSHVLVPGALSARQALATWASPDWALRCPQGDGTELAPLDGLPHPGPVNDQAVTAFLQKVGPVEDQDLATLVCPQRLAAAPRRRRELVSLMVRGCVLALQAGPASPRGRLVVLAEPGLTALLLYAAARFLPESLAAGLTFSTYENAHRDLRSYRHAQVVGTYTADPQKGLDEEFFTKRAYALDTFNHKYSPELDGDEEPAVDEWIELAARGEWAVIDKVHRLQGPANGSLVSFREALQAAMLSSRLAYGKIEAGDLLALKRSPGGRGLLEQHRAKVWPLIRDASLADARMRDEFADTLLEQLPELQERTAQALRAQPPENWLPHWRLLCILLRSDRAQLRETIHKVLPEPPYPPGLRLALLRELHTLQLSPVDQRQPGHALLRGCSADDLEEFARSDLPRDWYVWALCYGLVRRETRPEAVRRFQECNDELLRALLEQLNLLKDEEQRRLILAPLLAPSDPQRIDFFGRLLKQRVGLPPETLEWLLDWLGVLREAHDDFWCREDHLGHLMEMLRQAGEGSARTWERLCARLNADVLLAGTTYQKALLANLTAARDRPGAVVPPAAAQAIGDWVLLRAHFEAASAVPDDGRQAIIAACNRRGIDPIGVLPGYFARFVQPHGMKQEVLDDFAGFFHSFYREGDEHLHYSSRLIGWYQVVGHGGDEAQTTAYQEYYLENWVPERFRERLAEEMRQAGKLALRVQELPVESEPPATPPPVVEHGGEVPRSADAFQLSGVPLTSAWKRLPWLLCSLGGGVLAAYVCGLHRARLQHVAGLAMYVPVILALTESMAIQSAAVAVGAGRRGLGKGALAQWLAKQLFVALVLGVACGLAAGGLTAALGWPVRFALCLAAATAGGGACASVAGLGLPALLAWPRWGPRLAAGPVIRALAGALALLVYFSLAQRLLR